MAKQKYYPLKGEAENADNLNKYQEFRKRFEASLPKSKPEPPKYKKGEIPAAKAKQIARDLIAKGDFGKVVKSTVGKLNEKSTRQDSLKAYTNAAKGMAAAEMSRIKGTKLNNAANKAMMEADAFVNREKMRTAATDATRVARNLAVPLGESNFSTPQDRESLAQKLRSKKK